jgi:ADP-ribose pyrophosphatase YjhB (NUDIX family)
MSKPPVHVNHHVQHRYPLGIRFCPLCAGELEERILLPDGREHKICSQCGFVHFLGPKLVSGCLVIDSGRVLLLRRGIEPEVGKWTFPGGFVDFGETPTEAAVRETLEEVGMRVRIDRHLGLYADPANPHAAVAVYLASPGDEPPGISDEALEVRYFGATEIPWDEIAFRTTHDALRDWLALLK